MTLHDFLTDIATSSPPRSGWYVDSMGNAEAYFRRDTVLVDGMPCQVLNLANLRTSGSDALDAIDGIAETSLAVARQVPQIAGVLVSYADGAVVDAFGHRSEWRVLPGRSMGPGSASFLRLVDPGLMQSAEHGVLSGSAA